MRQKMKPNEASVMKTINRFIVSLSLSYLFVILSFISEFGGGTGWTLYPPLSTSFMSLSPSTTAYLIFGLLMSGISSCLTSINFFITILNLRSYYLTLKTMPLFPWSLLITGGMLLLTLPILSGALLMVLADLHCNSSFFDPIFGGDPIFYQHLFWFFGHPEVYILIIPAFGIFLKAVPNKNAGFIILLTSIFTFFFFPEIRNLTTFTRLMDYNNGFSISFFFFITAFWILSFF